MNVGGCGVRNRSSGIERGGRSNIIRNGKNGTGFGGKRIGMIFTQTC